MSIRASIDAAVAAAGPVEKDYAEQHAGEVRRYCLEPKVVFEIGAYTGVDIPAIHSLWPDAEIHCFEPSPENFARLKRFHSDHIICNQMALTDKTGPVTFYQVNDSNVTDQATRSEWFKTAGSLLHCGAQQCAASPSLVEIPIVVEGMTLDDYCRSRNVWPDILLIDTQGSEYQIIDGGREAMKHVKAALCEWSKLELYKDQRMFDDLVRLMKELGFEMKFEVNLWSNFHGDAVFVRP